MLIAVGMYLPFNTTFAIFVGGLIKYTVDKMGEKHIENDSDKEVLNNTGLLLASGLVAGEALVGIILAAFVGAGINLKSVFGLAPDFEGYWFLGLLVFVVLGYVLIKFPLKEMLANKSNTVHVEKLK